MSDTPSPIMTTPEAANYLRLAVRTLEDLRLRGTGPKFARLGNGRAVRYRREDLDAWVEASLVASTSAA